MEYKDYYKILGVEKSASQEEIAKVFKKKARQCHPDLNPGDSCAEGKFKDLNEAYEVLRDPEKRKLYDSLGPNWQDGQNFQPPPGFDNVRFHFGGQGGPGGQAGFDASAFSDFFETLFGGGFAGQGMGGFSGGRGSFGGATRRPARGQDARAGIELGLEEAHRGGERTITLQEPGIDASGRPAMSVRTLKVNIPPGVRDGSKIRLTGQGNPGSGGGGPGDLYLTVRLAPHSQFKIEDGDVVLDLPLAPWEAALGITVTVPTLDGPVELRIPPGMSSGAKLRLKAKGLGSGPRRSDQFVRLSIQTPASLTPEEKELWEKLAQTSRFHPRQG